MQTNIGNMRARNFAYDRALVPGDSAGNFVPLAKQV